MGSQEELPPPTTSLSADEPARARDVFPWTIELALSGGGLRATAFCLGAMLYLVHSGLNSNVRNIASVSGGSITNAFVGTRCDFSSVDVETFRKDIAAELARRIAKKGLFSAPHFWIYLFITLVAVFTWAYLTLPSLIHPIVFNSPAETIPLHPWLWLASTLIALVLLYGRGWPITRWMAYTFFTDGSSALTLADLSSRTVDHVFCATDLNRSLPFFFSSALGGRLYSEIYGRASKPQARVLTAVRASAAFPPLIPPIWFKPAVEWTYTEGFSFKSSKLPWAVWLTDGGAYNNFGTDWQRLRDNLYFDAAMSPEEISAMEEGGERSQEMVQRHFSTHNQQYGQVQIVIDASQIEPPSLLLRLHIPGWALITYIMRTMKVMYGSTLNARRERSEIIAVRRMSDRPDKWYPGSKFSGKIRDKPDSVDLDWLRNGSLVVFVALSQTPIEVFRRWGASAFVNSPDDKQTVEYTHEIDRAKRIYGDLWPTEQPDGWPMFYDLVRRMLFGSVATKRPVKTTFRSLGSATTLQLIVHGYIITRYLLTAAFGPYRPISLPDTSWFQDLVVPVSSSARRIPATRS